MRKKTVLVFLLMLAILIVAAPAAATRTEPVGANLNIYPGSEDETFPAGEPFNIAHGWGFIPPDDVPGSGLGFELWVDGVYREADFVDRSVAPNQGDGPSITWLWVHNFPTGMSGTHTFKGEWFASCSYAVRSGLYTGPCSAPNERVTVTTNTVEVDFIPQI